MPLIKITGINELSVKKDCAALKENINKLCFQKALVKLYYKYLPNVLVNVYLIIDRLKNNHQIMVTQFLYKDINTIYNRIKKLAHDKFKLFRSEYNYLHCKSKYAEVCYV